MNCAEFLKKSWEEHGSQPQQVADAIGSGIELIEKNDQIPSMAQLIVHIFGEHLGKWNEGISALNSLKNISCYEPKSTSEISVLRSIACLELAAGKTSSIENFSESEQILICAEAASALAEQKNTDKAQFLFMQALDKSTSGIPKNDPASRALAIAGNKIAVSLEERSVHTPFERDFMILAAQTARRFWEIAGTWLEVERAEYRLSQSYLKANEFATAVNHAQKCLKIVADSNGDALEFFYGYEALALAEKAAGNVAELADARDKAQTCFDKLSEDDKSWCDVSLKKIMA